MTAMQKQFDLAPTEWATLRRLLGDALDRPAAERASWVEQLDAEFEAFKPRLRALLEHAAHATGALPLDTLPKIETAQFLDGRRPGEQGPRAGAKVGPYVLIRRLGEGGMGEVWLAERTDMLQRRQVALKLPRLVTGRAEFGERLAREREILAALEHPNIARLYDAGLTADGQPYLALEYVEGERIDAYCKRKALDVPARLRLFLQVARAVAHAHSRLVVHRDLKPANILVTEAGEVRLLDFGIAKLLEDGRAQETELTQLAGRALTPDYAAPEQILGQPIGTAADVYALGVVLFELLSGSRPYQLKRDSRAALEEAIVQADVPRPSSLVTDAKLRKQLRGDLDTIVLKALKPSPAERYGTADAFVEDIERYLQNRPVQARPDSELYRIRKFAARNRIAVAAAASVLLAVVVGAAGVAWQAREARAEQQRAKEVKNFIEAIFRDTDPYQRTTPDPSVKDLLRYAHLRVNRELHERADTRVELLELVGASQKNIQDTDAALATLNEAVAVGQEELGAEHPLTLRARTTRLDLLRFLGRREELRKELETLLPLLRDGHGQPADLVVALSMKAHNAIDAANYPEAVAAAKESFDTALRNPDLRSTQASSSATLLALAYEYSRQPENAKSAAELGVKLARDANGETVVDSNTIEARIVLARALGELGQLASCIDEMERAIKDSQSHFGPTAIEVAFNLHNLVKYLVEAGNVKRAVEVSAMAERIFSLHAKPGTYFLPYARASHAMTMLAARGRQPAPQEIVSSLETASAELASVLGKDHPIYISVREGLAVAQAYNGDPSKARAVLDGLPDPTDRKPRWRTLRIRSIVERLDGHLDRSVAYAQQGLASISGARAELERMTMLPTLGLALAESRADRDAVSVLQEALTLLARHQTVTSPEFADALLAVGRALMHVERSVEALPYLERADQFWQNFDSGSRWAGEAAFWLGRCLDSLGRKDPAKVQYARAAGILAGSTFPGDAALTALAHAE